MTSGNGRASNRLVVGRGTEAGSGGSMPHRRFWRGVSRRVRLFAGLGLAVALLALLATPPLQAQSTTVTLVSNIDHGSAGGGGGEYAQSFQTGSDAEDYTISEVRVLVKGFSGSGNYVRINENDNDRPGDLVAELTNPGTITRGCQHVYRAGRYSSRFEHDLLDHFQRGSSVRSTDP